MAVYRKVFFICSLLTISVNATLALANNSMKHYEHHAGMDSSAQAPLSSLAKVNNLDLPSYLTLPKGKPLRPLPLIKNASTEVNLFTTTLLVEEAAIPLIDKQPAINLWLYNSTLLPLIELKIGDEFVVNVVNKLPQETTVHWHGLNVPASQDGNPQDPIKQGQSHLYRFKITEDMVGSHWFHPHTHNFVAEQMAKGLEGAFIIRDPHDPLQGIPEQNLFFSDLKLNAQGQIAPNSMFDNMNGREGQFALINGGWQPVINLQGTQRWRLWNGNSGRYLNLAFPKDQVESFLVGNDGGLLEKPIPIEEILLSPSERAEIVLTPKKNGQFLLIAKKYDRHKMGNIAPEQDLVLATVNTQEGKKITLPNKLRTIADFGKPTVKRRLVYSEDNQMNFLINGKKFDMERIDIASKVNQVEEWEIFNNSHMDHNFHLHGHQFLVKEFESEKGNITKPAYKLLKDSINLKPYETIRVIVKQDKPGIRMYHCHIIEHEKAGMMGQVEVAEF